ncbi:MAG: hypothetical protein IKU34_12345 [Clostridia bacterium]|nr:hypothetical protein [Clostridia bacterium]
MYDVFKRVRGCRVWLAACGDIEEASRVIRADAVMSEVGCVYEIELKEEVPA